MAWAQEMKNLAAAIKTSHEDRAAGIKQIKKDTRDILSDADEFMKKAAHDLKEAAKDLRDFLAKSEDTRKKDFHTLLGDIHKTLKDIQSRIKEIRKDTQDSLVKMKETRSKDFTEFFRVITSQVKDIRGSTADLLSRYDQERKKLSGDIKKAAGELQASLKEGEMARVSEYRKLMEDIKGVLGDITEGVKTLMKSTQKMLDDHRAERKEAAGYWVGLSRAGKSQGKKGK